MKINISKEEFKKATTLLDYKEINISIAQMLFQIYQEDEFFYGAVKPDSFFKKLLNYWNISEKEDISLLNKWVKPNIFVTQDDYFDNNAYYKLIKPKSVFNNDIKLEYFTFKAFQPFPLDDIQVDDNDYYLEKTPISYFLKDHHYLALTKNNVVWMSITPNEINTMSPYIDACKGDVLVLGLGLGYYPLMALLKKEVNKITIVELDKDIIEIFNKFILPYFPQKDKIEIVEGDAIKYLANNNKKYDTVFVDLWHSPEDGLPLYLKIKQIEKQYKDTNFQYWLEKSIIAYYRRFLLAIFEETTLRGFKDEDYRNTTNDVDLIINEIYAKTKNVTINNYDDLYNLLKDESIKSLI